MKLHPLMDSISSVELIDHMGADLSVVNAARVSMSKESHELVPQDSKLLKYLADHKHWTPFSHPQVSLRIKMPIFIARQWFKHQVGFTRNEVSRRYVDETPQFYVESRWRGRAANVKQGSSDQLVEGIEDVAALYSAVIEIYESMLRSGVCPEQARMILPQSMYTEFVETASLAAYARLAGLRLDPHAQLEVRLYAASVSEIVGGLFPESWKALGVAP